MSSLTLGNTTSEIEVTNISIHGIWILVGNKEYFLSFEDFPWFKDQPISAIFHVVELSPGHFYWPALDIDLTKEIIEHPERFPLISKNSEQSKEKHESIMQKNKSL
jgi:hypothetical protein